MDIKELGNILQQNGIVGAGGAGFPTYAKLNENAETIILNCAECEPLLRLHRQLLEKNAREIVETFYMMGQTMGSKDIVIGIKKAYKDAIEALNAVIDDYEGVRLGLLDEVYPAGDEVVLIYEVTGKVVRPGGLPIECGVAVFNVETSIFLISKQSLMSESFSCSVIYSDKYKRLIQYSVSAVSLSEMCNFEIKSGLLMP